MEESKPVRKSASHRPHGPWPYVVSSSQLQSQSGLLPSSASLPMNPHHFIHNTNNGPNTTSGNGLQNLTIHNNTPNNRINTSGMYYRHPPQYHNSYYGQSYGQHSDHLSPTIAPSPHQYLRGPLVPRPILSRSRSPLPANRNLPSKESSSCTEVALIFRTLDIFPEYDVIRLGGKDHQPLFEATISVEKFGLHAKGEGGSKMACRRAAADSLIQLLQDPDYRSRHFKDPDTEKIISQRCGGRSKLSETPVPAEEKNCDQLSLSAGKGNQLTSASARDNTPLFFVDRKPDISLEAPLFHSSHLSPVDPSAVHGQHKHSRSKIEQSSDQISKQICSPNQKSTPQSNDIHSGHPSKSSSGQAHEEMPASNGDSKEAPLLADISRVQAVPLASAQSKMVDTEVVASPLKRSLARIVTGCNYSKPEPTPASSPLLKSPDSVPSEPVATTTSAPRPLSGSPPPNKPSKLAIRSIPLSRPRPLSPSLLVSSDPAVSLEKSVSSTDGPKNTTSDVVVPVRGSTSSPCHGDRVGSPSTQMLNKETTPVSVPPKAIAKSSEAPSNLNCGLKRSGSPACHFSLKKAASSAASASVLCSSSPTVAPSTDQGMAVPIGCSMRLSSHSTSADGDGLEDTHKLTGPRLGAIRMEGSPCAVESVPPRKRAKSLQHELPIPLRLLVFAALDDEIARQSMISLAHSTFHVDLEVVLFSSNASAKYYILCERLTAQVRGVQVGIDIAPESAICAYIAFTVGVASQRVWIDRAKHSALRLPLALSPRLVILHNNPMLSTLREEGVIDVFSSGESLVDFSKTLLLDAKKELFNLGSKSNAEKLDSVNEKDIVTPQAIYDFRDSPTSTASTKGDVVSVVKAKE